MRARRVGVVGLGLMGGSLARALAARGVRVMGFDRDRSSLDAAVAEGMVHEPLDDSLAGVERADVVVLATPVAATGALAHAAGRPARRPVADHGRGEHEAEHRRRGGSGGAGPALRGSASAHRQPSLRVGRIARVAVRGGARVPVPEPSTTPRGAPARRIVLAIGCAPAWRCSTPRRTTSRWRGAATCRRPSPRALALTLRQANVTRSALGPGGRDMTRLAGGDPDLWTGIVERQRAGDPPGARGDGAAAPLLPRTAGRRRGRRARVLRRRPRLVRRRAGARAHAARLRRAHAPRYLP